MVAILMMKICANKLPDGKYELFLECRIELPVRYSEKDIETLENNRILFDRCSYYGGAELTFRLKKELMDEIRTAVMETVTERK
jgi:hypothetical protein